MAHALTTVAIDAQDYISLQKARLHSFTALSELENIKTKLLKIDWYYRSYRSTITGQVWGTETDVNLWNWICSTLTAPMSQTECNIFKIHIVREQQVLRI